MTSLRLQRVRLTLLTVVALEAERTAALERVAYRHAATAVQARLVDARVLAVLDVRAVQVLLQQLQRPLVDDHLTTRSQSARLVNCESAQSQCQTY